MQRIFLVKISRERNKHNRSPIFYLREYCVKDWATAEIHIPWTCLILQSYHIWTKRKRLLHTIMLISLWIQCLTYKQFMFNVMYNTWLRTYNAGRQPFPISNLMADLKSCHSDNLYESHFELPTWLAAIDERVCLAWGSLYKFQSFPAPSSI